MALVPDYPPAATHFSFLRGASSAEELFAQAAMLGIPALGVT
jgi:error-prone DNA polymerase